MPEEKKEVANDEWMGRALEIFFIVMLVLGLFNWIAPRVETVFNTGFSGVGGEDVVSIPPQNEQAENKLLGALISGRANAEESFAKLNEGMFRNTKNRAVFLAAKSLFNDGIPINIDTLMARLSESGQLANVGGGPYLESLIASVDEGKGSIYSSFEKMGNIIRAILLWIALFSIIGIAYVSGKLVLLEKEEVALALDVTPEINVSKSDTVWKRLLELSQSKNPSDRKIAIIEADAILDDMVSKMGHDGDTLGEKLKKIENSDFLTLEEAWEAHKFRNTIAHSGVAVTERDAQRIMLLYERVFREFEYL